MMTQHGNCFVLANMVSLKCVRSFVRVRVCVYVCVRVRVCECMACVLVYAWTRVCESTMWLKTATALNLCKILGCL